MSRFAYFYFMKGEPEDIRHLAPKHAAYWRGRALEGYEGGPFSDRTGGLITFEAQDRGLAAGLVASDPFQLGGVIGDSWLKEWRPE